MLRTPSDTVVVRVRGDGAARPLVIFGGQPIFKYEPVVRAREERKRERKRERGSGTP